jgi:2-oxoglutarate dehydrogenase E2 component (dihydrolipoamide succinyltransferase)
MPVDVKVPSVGESIVEGTIARWLKKDGEAVRADEPLFELETDKATGEVPAPAAGVLKITAPEGETVAIGAVVGQIDTEAKAAAGAPQQPAREAPAKPEPAKKLAAPPNRAGSPTEAPPLSPAVRRLVAENQIDVRQVHGTGPAGRITKDDVLTHLEKKPEPASANATAMEATPETPATPAATREAQTTPAAARETRQRMSAIRQRIAERLVAAQNTAAILTTFNEADMTAVMELRSRYKESFQKKHGVGLGFMSFFVKAAVEALRAFPALNAMIDGTDVVYRHYYDIGVAVSTDKGLMVPIVRGADQLSFADIEKRIVELALKARDGKIGVNDLQGGTFTITNGGIFGSLLSTPILNPPQSGILGMHAIQKRPVAIDDQVVIRPMMYLALSYDHRLIDGREAVQFLVRIKECIESPERLMLEV